MINLGKKIPILDTTVSRQALDMINISPTISLRFKWGCPAIALDEITLIVIWKKSSWLSNNISKSYYCIFMFYIPNQRVLRCNFIDKINRGIHIPINFMIITLLFHYSIIVMSFVIYDLSWTPISDVDNLILWSKKTHTQT